MHMIAHLSLKNEFASADRHRKTVLGGGDRAGPVVVIGAIRVVGQVEVDHHPPIGQQFRLKVAPRPVGLLARQSVGEGQKERVAVGVERQRRLLPLN